MFGVTRCYMLETSRPAAGADQADSLPGVRISKPMIAAEIARLNTDGMKGLKPGRGHRPLQELVAAPCTILDTKLPTLTNYLNAVRLGSDPRLSQKQTM